VAELALTVKETATATGLSESTIYRAALEAWLMGEETQKKGVGVS
jgi:predicted DNA-binding transcriptional regulator AlpA